MGALPSMLGIGVAFAGVPELPSVRHVGVAHGLPSSTVNGIVEDRDGYVWLATTDGLARHDGAEIMSWRHDPADPAALPGNVVTAVHVDPRNRVWVATEARGLSVMDDRRNGFRHYRADSHPGMGSDEVWAITSCGGALWFGTFGGGLHRLLPGPGPEGDEIERFGPVEGDASSLPATTVLALACDSRDRLWAGTTAGLAMWNGRAFDRVPLPGEAPAPMVYSISVEGDGVWVGSRTGLFRRSGGGAWSQPPWSDMFAAGNAVFSVVADGDAYWLASQRHLWRAEPGRVPFPVSLGADGPVLALQQILRQDNGALWVPVGGVGAGYLRPDWRRLARFKRGQGGLTSDLYRAIANAGAGGRWLLGGRGELDLLDASGDVRPMDEALAARMDGRLTLSAAEDEQGRLWIGTGGRGELLRLDPATAEVREWTATSASDATLGGQIDLMALAPDGTLWLSSAGAGLQQRDPEDGQVLRTILAGAGQGLGLGDLEAIAFDGAGRPWVAGGHGVARWHASLDRFVPVTGIDIGDRVFGLAFDGPDALWLQTLSGLHGYRRSGDGWVADAVVGHDTGIPAVEGSGLVVDPRHRVWLASLRGLYRWDPATTRLRRFGLADGLGSQEFVHNALAIGSDGVLAAALADGGILLLDTLADDPPARQPAMHWDRIEVRRGGRWEPLDRLAASLSPEDRELRVGLRLLAFEDPGGIRYYTRMEGYDPGWVAHGAQGERVFTGLAPGRYTLHARGVDAAGNAAAEQVLRFEVQPPWWRSQAALMGFAAALALLLWWVADLYRARLARRQAWQRIEHEREVEREASLAKTRFLATLGHEVRTPMTGVLGMTELLLGTPLDSLQRSYADAVRGAGEHLLRLVNDALDLARIESGKLDLAQEAFDLRLLLDEVVALMSPLARAQGLAFEVDLDDAPHGVRGDPVRLRQILLNLLGNAIKFTERGHVRLQVSGCRPSFDGEGTAMPHGLRLRVIDSGPGLNEEQLTRLFQRFEQAHGARTAARYGGSGLGLAICQELAAAMGGEIGVESSPGVGTRFEVRLPLAHVPLPERPVETASQQPDPLSSPRTHVILLVEDDRTVAEVIAGLLRAQGHRVVHAGHGLAALAEASTGAFDLALLDLDLPGLDGVALARQLRTLGFTAPLVAITARADADAEPEAMAAGFDHFLRKPVTGATLRSLMGRLSEQAATPVVAEAP